MNRHLAVALAAMVCGACATTPRGARTTPVPAAARDSAAFEQLITEYVSSRGRGEGADTADPVRAVVHALEPARDRERAERATTWLGRLRAIDTNRLDTAQRIDWLMLEAQLKRQVRDTALHSWRREPGRYLTVGGIYWRIAGDRPPRADDWVAVRRDLEAAPAAIALGRSVLEAPPPLWVRLALGTARSYRDFLRGELPERAAAAPDSLRGPVLAAADRAAAALDGYAAFLADTLRAGADDSWMAGRDYYDWVTREVNFLPYSADSMIAAGRRIHEATKRALDSLAAQLRPGVSWRVLAEEMRARHPEPGRIIAAYERESRRVEALIIRDDLVTLPPCQELAFVATPPQLRQTYAWGGYGGIQNRDSVAVGRFFVTDVWPGMTDVERREKLRAQNNGWVSVIALHEGYPGHHLQTVYARRNPRRLRRQMANTYYGEGWALYAEHWMARAGLFETADARLAQLQMRLWRTARVIIDPSLHTGAMTYAQAVQFFVDEVGLERSAAEAEVNRFTTWPTQAPSYIVGWLEIERLKAEVQASEGATFSEKRFVETVLEAGSLPLALLRRVVLERLEASGDDVQGQR
jgi:uncharacterized protein (DUF885 family)